MRTALLLTGNPRFSADFDSQINNLKNSSVDWFITFWNRPDGFDPKISPNWCNLTEGKEIKEKSKKTTITLLNKFKARITFPE